MSQSTALEARDLKKSYGDTVALDGVSISVPVGGVLALLGPNGAGKSTLTSMDPEVRFGRPSIKGISTSVLAEQVDDGASPEEVASDFNLAADDVRWAVAYEASADLKPEPRAAA